MQLLRYARFARNVMLATALGVSLGFGLVGLEYGVGIALRYAKHYRLETQFAATTNPYRETVYDEFKRLYIKPRDVPRPAEFWFNDPDEAKGRCRDGMYADLGPTARTYRFVCPVRD